MMTPKQLLRQAVDEQWSGVGCYDAGCVFGHPGGMQTNGGCSCLKDVDARAVYLRVLRAAALELARRVLDATRTT